MSSSNTNYVFAPPVTVSVGVVGESALYPVSRI